jgi:hypothetical protein
MGLLSIFGGPGAWIGDAVKNALTGPLIGGLVDYQKAKLAAGNTAEATAAQLATRELLVEQREAEVNASVVIAEQGRWYTAIIRPLMVAPFIIFTWKVIVFDKVMGWGFTDALDPKMWNVFMIAVGSYFGGRTIEKVARIIKR